jgi:hypothetical protein
LRRDPKWRISRQAEVSNPSDGAVQCGLIDDGADQHRDVTPARGIRATQTAEEREVTALLTIEASDALDAKDVLD